MTTPQPIPGTSARASVLPWIILFVVVVGFGVFTFRDQIADVLSTDSQAEPSEIEVLTGEGMLTRIQDLKRLETVAFHMQTVVTATKDTDGLKGYLWKQKALFIVDGKITAGVDLGELSSSDIRLSADGKSARITLPPVKIFDSQVVDLQLYNQEKGLLKFGEVEQSLRAEAESDARKSLRATACASDILDVAQENAVSAVENLFALTDIEVFVTPTSAAPCSSE